MHPRRCTDVLGRALGRAAVMMAVVVAAALAVITVGAAPASACSCSGVTLDEAYAAADVVFTGQVTGRSAAVTLTPSSADRVDVSFAVDRVFKGEAVANQQVATARDGASCGLELDDGADVVVFARFGQAGADGWPDPDELGASQCSGSQAVPATGLPASFGTGAQPGAATETTTTTAVWGGPAVITAVLAMAAIGWTVHRRRAGRSPL
jgi:hypothetical protein